MLSASLTLPSPFLSAKATPPPPPPTSFSSRRPLRVSATATAARTTPCTPRIATPASLYDVLGIHTGATRDEIKTAYYRLAKTSHPDVRSDGGKDDEFIRIHAAYSTLYNPEKRADYDRSLLGRRSYGMPPRFSARTRRTWETDQCW